MNGESRRGDPGATIRLGLAAAFRRSCNKRNRFRSFADMVDSNWSAAATYFAVTSLTLTLVPARWRPWNRAHAQSRTSKPRSSEFEVELSDVRVRNKKASVDR
jgi:hypothetical protein